MIVCAFFLGALSIYWANHRTRPRQRKIKQKSTSLNGAFATTIPRTHALSLASTSSPRRATRCARAHLPPDAHPGAHPARARSVRAACRRPAWPRICGTHHAPRGAQEVLHLAERADHTRRREHARRTRAHPNARARRLPARTCRLGHTATHCPSSGQDAEASRVCPRARRGGRLPRLGRPPSRPQRKKPHPPVFARARTHTQGRSMILHTPLASR